MLSASLSLRPARGPFPALAALSALLLSASGCSGNVVTETSGDGGSGTSTSTSQSTTEATSGTGGSTGTPTECVVAPQGTGGFQQPTCADLSVLTITNPVITDDATGNGDGLVNAGETVVLTVDLNEVAGIGFNAYPGVTFTPMVPAIMATNNNWLYAMLPCTTTPMDSTLTIGASIPPGTVLTIRAQTAMLSTDCPDAPYLDIPLTIH